VWFLDLNRLGTTSSVNSSARNPFSGSPLFTPDGRLLYLVDGGSVEAIDLVTKRMSGPATIPRQVSDKTPLAWLVELLTTQVEAGGIATTVPLSPDGLRFYAAQDLGVMVLQLPNLKPIGKLATGTHIGEVWISGDGQTIYATTGGTDRGALLVLSADGGHQIRVELPDQPGGYIASEHG
jgi:hypothetical protein